MLSSSAYLFVFHGSSDPRSGVAADRLVQGVRDRLQAADVWRKTIPGRSPIPSVLGHAYLECAPLPLHLQIQQFCQQWFAKVATADHYELHLFPLFLLPGVHVMEDIPGEVERAQALLPPSVSLRMQPYLGSLGKLRRLIMETMATLPVEAWILLAHGSRRPGANETVESLAAAMGAVTAYWSCAPSLEERLMELRQNGLRRMAIFPYCLFPGGITDAIAQTLTTLSQQDPQLDLTLTAPLGANPALVDLLLDLAVYPSEGQRSLDIVF